MHMVGIEPHTTEVGGRCTNHFTTSGCTEILYHVLIPLCIYKVLHCIFIFMLGNIIMLTFTII
ncbi:hypothetical protein ACOSP7_014161 [Xanthoceras sorbifolium]